MESQVEFANEPEITALRRTLAQAKLEAEIIEQRARAMDAQVRLNAGRATLQIAREAMLEKRALASKATPG